MNLSHKRIAEKGDLVILYERKDSLTPVTLTPGEKYQCILGAFLHDDIIGKEYGSIVSGTLFCQLIGEIANWE